MYRLFPRLRERASRTQAGVLSGGEQQMLTLARTMMGDPELVIIDEPTEGLAPMIVELVANFLRELKEPRPLDPADRAEAHDRDADLAAGLRDGARAHGLSRHARRTQANQLIRQEWLEV